MTLALDSLLFLLGISFLWYGGNTVVDGAAGIARRFHISELIIGLTLVSIGTSLPEVVVNIIASINKESDIVLGNIIGSNISNTTLILGSVGVLGSLSIPQCRLRREINFYVITLFIFLFCIFSPSTHSIPFWQGTLLMVVFFMAAYMFFIPKESDIAPTTSIKPSPLLKNILIFTGGCVLLPMGGHFLVKSSISIASTLGLSKSFISLFAVALGTSLPELATSIIAAKKGNTSLAIGNIIGSNIFNITLVLGLSSMISTISFSPILSTDALILCLSTIPFVFYLWFSSSALFSKTLSYGYLCFYCLYTIYIYVR
ncbi:hypothetical protein DID78_01805 [Candidatus Marinamargulisbacteria bacterium SCGC AG-343-D04]|nr:hypothetical protein DID78_01805 [Candidatus Marinamargulisbacteria bacterium SCGC AG-343-D04]